jgi:hypothetical protein
MTGEKKKTKTFRSKFLIVATSPNPVGAPHMPIIPKKELFLKSRHLEKTNSSQEEEEVKTSLSSSGAGAVVGESKVIHSSVYVSGETYRGQKVLVVGIGNSGAEIALDLWEHGAEPLIFVRSPLFIIPRWLAQQTQDRNWPKFMRESRLLPLFVHDVVTALVLYFTMGDLSKYGIRNKIWKLMSSHVLSKHPPLMDIGTIDLIKKQEIKIIEGYDGGIIKEFYEKGVIVNICGHGGNDNNNNNNNNKEDVKIEVDAVVMATGYENIGGFETWLDASILSKINKYKESNPPEVYNTKYSSLYGGSGEISKFHNKLAFCGFNDFTGLLQEIRLESIVLAKNIRKVLS